MVVSNRLFQQHLPTTGQSIAGNIGPSTDGSRPRTAAQLLVFNGSAAQPVRCIVLLGRFPHSGIVGLVVCRLPVNPQLNRRRESVFSFSLYLAISPWFGWLWLIIPFLLSGGSIAIYYHHTRTAWSLLAPFVGVSGWLAIAVMSR